MLNDHPTIKAMERYGYPEKPEEEYRMCPVTGEWYTWDDDDLLFDEGISFEGLKEIYDDEMGREFIESEDENADEMGLTEIKNYCFDWRRIDRFARFVIENDYI